jgi:tRNA threonylcarbamoyl adenosine modification protein YeaZ
MMTLVLDTSTEMMLMAIVNDSTIQSFRFEHLERQHAEQLLPTLATLLQQSACSITDIDSIIVSNGPGSFTGVRLAITFVKTLALTQSLDVYALPSLASLAKPNQCVLATLDARANRHYVAAYDGFEIVLQPTIMTQAEQETWLLSHPLFQRRQLGDPTLDGIGLISSLIQWKKLLQPLSDIHVLTPSYLKDLQ